MISQKELEFAISDLEKAEPTYQVCAKLADLYVIRDHIKPSYSEKSVPAGGSSEFLRLVSGKDTGAVMQVMDELMETTQVLNPRLYEAVIKRMNEL